MNPYRRQRVQERIREILNLDLRMKTRDPALAGVYVTDVEVTADLRLAKVYWRSESPVGQKIVNAGLNRSRGFLRWRRSWGKWDRIPRCRILAKSSRLGSSSAGASAD